jgi:hypothetical protein
MTDQGKLTLSILDVPEDLDAIYEAMYVRGWTDGLPIIPPTEERVWRMIEYAALPPDHVVATIPPPLHAEVTVGGIAVNAVMAGCKPEYMPVIIAAVEGMCEPQFNLSGFMSSTNSHGVAVVINGSIRKKLDVNCGWNCLGQGRRANATIGRAVSLIVTNIGGFKPGEVDKATHGYPGKYTLCFGEFEEESHWEPLHVERGFRSTDNTVTVFAIGTTMALISLEPDLREWLRIHADAMAYMGCGRFRMGRGEALMVFTPPLTRRTAEAGMTKADIKAFLFEHACIPQSKFPAHMDPRTWDVVSDGVAHPVRRPEDILLVVAGLGSSLGPPLESTFLDPYADTRSVTKLIREPGGA